MDSTSEAQQTAALLQVAVDILRRRRMAGLALVDQAEAIALPATIWRRGFTRGETDRLWQGWK